MDKKPVCFGARPESDKDCVACAHDVVCGIPICPPDQRCNLLALAEKQLKESGTLSKVVALQMLSLTQMLATENEILHQANKGLGELLGVGEKATLVAVRGRRPKCDDHMAITQKTGDGSEVEFCPECGKNEIVKQNFESDGGILDGTNRTTSGAIGQP